MNKFVSVLMLGSALALSACGGDSDSSGSYNSSTPKPTIPTKNKACNITGNTVTGFANSSCLFENTSAQANIVITCNGNKMILDGKLGGFTSAKSEYNSGANINGYILRCS